MTLGKYFYPSAFDLGFPFQDNRFDSLEMEDQLDFDIHLDLKMHLDGILVINILEFNTHLQDSSFLETDILFDHVVDTQKDISFLVMDILLALDNPYAN